MITNQQWRCCQALYNQIRDGMPDGTRVEVHMNDLSLMITVRGTRTDKFQASRCVAIPMMGLDAPMSKQLKEDVRVKVAAARKELFGHERRDSL